MDVKSGVERPTEGPKEGGKASSDRGPVQGGMSDASRKNNTEATQTVSELPRGNETMAPTVQSATDISSQAIPDADLTLPKAKEPSDATAVTKTGTESIKKPAESHPEKGDASGTKTTRVTPLKVAPDAKKSMKGDGSEAADTGNDQVTVDRSNEALINAKPSVQAATASSTTQPVSVLPSSLAPMTDKTLPIPKTVSFSNSVDVSVGITESPLAAVASVGQIPLKPQTTASPDTAKPPPDPQVNPSGETAVTKEPITKAPEPSIDDTIRKLRAPLVDKYSSFIAPTDTSLAAARERLRTAIEETRVLRAAFTDRVYEKYRVLLHPVEKSVDQIIERIKADPAGVSLKLQEDIRMVKQEKDIEKKEAQKLHAAVAANAAIDGTLNSRINAQETAEQLAWFGAGLNIVILPEEDLDDEIDMTKYPHRGPTNPETGQRDSGSVVSVLLRRRLQRGC